ncbi:sigma-70 family RNA polymerase sigma factor [Marinicella sp. S1101]|uniref:RNA polymerase sigma factor n=1 Tax=Marinicella marina TaxID=2996016 RepID=UPI002260C17D|nr:sigma-70 family RNA polymerase sigma factor [Marinicella marina]MCX7552983.1 sigma-70 family RNA polymerase sigma factor [Marinicella marina]MDJ1139707.1 sigma-70 family RNA polymerase sigma factor [Marinicella marina]
MNRKKLDHIFRQHQHLIEKAVYSQNIQILGVTADDVYQEVSIRLIKVLESDREIENLSSYIYRTAANVIIDLARKHQRYNQDVSLPNQNDEHEGNQNDLISETIEPEQEILGAEVQQQVLAAIESLPESRRIAVKLRLQGYSVKEMAEITGWPFYKAENLSKRGMGALKDKLSQLNIDYDIN